MFCALAIFSSLLGSTMPSPLYPLYVHEWSIGQSAVTTVFAIYTIGPVTSSPAVPIDFVPSIVAYLPVFGLSYATAIGLSLSRWPPGPARAEES